MGSFSVASADLSDLDPANPAFDRDLNALANALASVEPEAVCLQGVPGTAVLRALTAYLVRKQSRLLRTAAAREAPGSERHLGLLFRQTNAVTRRFEEPGGERNALAVRLLEPKAWLVSARRPLAADELEGPAILAGAAGAPNGFSELPGEGTAAGAVRGLEAGEHGTISAGDTGIAIRWWKLNA